MQYLIDSILLYTDAIMTSTSL